MWDFEHPPLQSELAERYAVSHMMPAQCAARLALPAGDPDAADIGLVPIAAYAETPDLAIVPGCAVASKGAIRSLLLVFRKVSGLEAIRTVAADTSSRATFAYVQILFKKYWRQPVSYRAAPAEPRPHASGLRRGRVDWRPGADRPRRHRGARVAHRRGAYLSRPGNSVERVHGPALGLGLLGSAHRRDGGRRNCGTRCGKTSWILAITALPTASSSFRSGRRRLPFPSQRFGAI